MPPPIDWHQLWAIAEKIGLAFLLALPTGWMREKQGHGVGIPGVGARFLLSYIPIEVYYARPFQRPDSKWVFGFNIIPGW